MKTVLIVTMRGGIIGDSIREESLLEKYHDKDTRIIYCGVPFLKQLFQNNPKLDEYIEVPEFSKLNKDISRLRKGYYLMMGYKRLRQVLAKKIESLDIGIITSTRGFRNWLSRRLMQSLGASMIVQQEDTDFRSYPSKLYFSKEEEEEYERKFKKLKNFVYLQADASSRKKSLTLNHLDEIAELFRKQKKLLVIDGVKTYGKEVKEGEFLKSTVGKTSVREAGYLMKKSDFAIVNDSGMAHIGAAVGTDLIVLTPFEVLDMHNDPKKSKVVKLMSPSSDIVIEAIKNEIQNQE